MMQNLRIFGASKKYEMLKCLISMKKQIVLKNNDSQQSAKRLVPLNAPPSFALAVATQSSLRSDCVATAGGQAPRCALASLRSD